MWQTQEVKKYSLNTPQSFLELLEKFLKMSWEEEVNRDTDYLVQDDQEEPLDNGVVGYEEEIYANDDAALSTPIDGLHWHRTYEKSPLYFEDDGYGGITFRRAATEPVHFAPERGPPILDFLSVFAAFVVAVIAAFYSIM